MTQQKGFEDLIRNAKTLEEAERLYQEAMKATTDPKERKRISRAYEKAIFEIKKRQFETLKAELAQRKRKYRRQKLDVNVRVTRRVLKTNIATAEHYVAMIQKGKAGINILFLRKVKLEEQEGYLLLIDKKMRKTWVLTADPLLMERQKFPFGKKLVALHFAMPNYSYTLSLQPDEKVREIALKEVNAPTIMHSLAKTKFFEALVNAGGGIDYTMLIIGAIMGVGIGLAIGFGIGDSNLSHLLATHVVSTTTHIPTNTSTTTTISPPPNSTRVVST
jgi:hypothetical protein